MPQSLSQILVHIIFSTKNREPFLKDAGVRKEMHAYLAAVLEKYDSRAWLVGGTADHVHVLCDLSHSQTLAKVVGESKRSSSRWVKTKGITRFYWQAGYGAFSVSCTNAATVKQYIAEQDRHHARRSFQDEYRVFLRGHRLEFDERYVWD